MITENGMNQTKNKLTRFIGTLKSLMFRPVGSIETTLYQTKQPLNEIPDARLFKPADSPAWGGDGVYGWFKGEYTVPAELDGKIEAAAADYQELARLMEEKQQAEDTLAQMMEQWEALSCELEDAT